MRGINKLDHAESTSYVSIMAGTFDVSHYPYKKKWITFNQHHAGM